MKNTLMIDRLSIEKMDKRFRTNLINCISGFKSLNLCGTISTEGVTNVAPISSVVHIGADPPLQGMIIRPVSVPRDTYQNIIDTGYFTLNHVQEGFYKQAHQSAARYDRDKSEFEKTGLTAEFINDFKAPFVGESIVKTGFKLIEEIDIRSNGTKMLIGEVIQMHIPESFISDDGYLDIHKAGSLTVSGLDGYYKTEIIDRLSYPKPDKKLESIG
ncbi:flavin reductase family protein [Mangrovivirga sp. M17]|uniref:Flavin reductase family protein n=1 Tax=Mangrovivirga halotolerans TaxID=2993936 RepID=A0ABT3RQS8_9BACT|nr:flavin reductase family protein [Mangrovivirga halotolerans]MCX2743617.1 flavin reductase family protein [Mangrovivirga halotolerans]